MMSDAGRGRTSSAIALEIGVAAQTLPGKASQKPLFNAVIVVIRRPPVELRHTRPRRTAKLRCDNPEQSWLQEAPDRASRDAADRSVQAVESFATENENQS